MLTHLRYFDEIVRTGSVRLAAERLRITPSAISRQIRNIEASIGSPLFERHARGMILTSAGELYARYARSSLLDEDRIHAEVDDLKGLRRGHIRVCLAEGVLDSVVAQIVAFRARYSAVTFQLSVVGSPKILPLLRAGEMDVGVTYSAEMQVGIRYVSRHRSPVMAIMHPRHPLAGSARLTFAELVNNPLALPDKGLGLRRLIDAQCHASRLIVRPILETNSIDAMLNFVRAGGGLTFLSMISVSRHLKFRTIAAVPLRDRELQKGTVDLCVLEGRTLSNATAAFVIHLQQALAKSGDLAA